MTHVITTPRTATRIGVYFAAVLLCLMTLFGTSSAQAHDELISSTPASGEVLKSAPTSLVLTFSGDLKNIGTILELSTADGKKVGTTFKVDRREVAVTPESPLANGSYKLVTRVVSSDGHPIDKTISFEVKGPVPAASSAPAAADAPDRSAPAAAPAPTTTAEPTATAADTDSNQSIAGMPAGLTWTIIGLAGVVLIALVLLKVRRQTK